MLRTASDVPRQPFQLLPVAPMHPLLAVQIDPPNFSDGLVVERCARTVQRTVTVHQAQGWLSCALAGDVNTQSRRAVAGSQLPDGAASELVPGDIAKYAVICVADEIVVGWLVVKVRVGASGDAAAPVT
jgi:hypothetical protein